MVVAVKERFADRPVLVTGIYASCIQIGAAIAAGLSVPLADAGDSWRAPMLVFSLARRRLARLVARGDARRRPAPGRQARALPAAQAGRVALRRALRARRPSSTTATPRGCPTPSRSTAGRRATPAQLVVADQHLRDRLVGLGDARRRPLPLVAAHAADPAVRAPTPRARSGIALDPAHALVWACVTGCGNGAIFPLMMTLPLDAADRPEQVAGVVGMMLGIGYCIGALAPLALGALRDATGLVRSRPLGDRGARRSASPALRVLLAGAARPRRARARRRRPRSGQPRRGRSTSARKAPAPASSSSSSSTSPRALGSRSVVVVSPSPATGSALAERAVERGRDAQPAQRRRGVGARREQRLERVGARLAREIRGGRGEHGEHARRRQHRLDLERLHERRHGRRHRDRELDVAALAAQAPAAAQRVLGIELAVARERPVALAQRLQLGCGARRAAGRGRRSA